MASALPPDLDAYVANSMKVFDVPGMGVAIVKDGKVIAEKGYGVRKLGDPTLVDAFTMFAIGSNTKAFTTAALATLVDQGRLSWDDRVYERLPGFVMYDPYVSHEMTIRDLLTHRSGMGLGEGDLLFWPHTTYQREDIIYRLRFMKPHSSFRSHYAYDNLLYMTAGQIIPAVTGISWDDYMRQHILEPLGMKHSTVSNHDFKPGDNYAFPHSRVDGKLQVIQLEDLDNVGPAGSMNSCAADMAKWVQLQLNRGKFVDRMAISSPSNNPKRCGPRRRLCRLAILRRRSPGSDRTLSTTPSAGDCATFTDGSSSATPAAFPASCRESCWYRKKTLEL